MKAVAIHHGDCFAVIRDLPDDSISSVVCDPPYAIAFMGKAWDTGDTAFDPAFWAEVKRVLKPGGHVVAASGTRTYHRLACAIEDAGFEVRDMISWLYGSGFPKSHDVSKGIDKAAGNVREIIRERYTAKRIKPGATVVAEGGYGKQDITFTATDTAPGSEESAAWQGWGTALKPACEPWVLARKPLSGTVASNVLAHGTGALNIDGCRVSTEAGEVLRGGSGGIPCRNDVAEARKRKGEPSANRRYADNGATNFAAKPGPRGGDDKGRWPANVIHDGSAEVVEAFPETSSGLMKAGTARKGERSVFGQDAACGDAVRSDTPGDSGSAARFFYSAKADADDRMGSKHPTVKPIDLMRYLVRLITPPGGVVLDPFAGSGSTGVAAMLEGFDSILIEREADYVADIRRKVDFYRGEGRLGAQEKLKAKQDEHADLPLFGGAA